MASTLTRPRDGRIIAGVCAGLAERFGWSPFVVRLVFLLSLPAPGPQFIIYLVLWVIMPNAARLTRSPSCAERRAVPGAPGRRSGTMPAVTDRTERRRAWPAAVRGVVAAVAADPRPRPSGRPARPRTVCDPTVITAPDLRGHTVLALHAHPDDEAIFTGITLRRLADAGARTVLVVATAGELGSSRVPLRPGETIPRAAARRAGARRRAARRLPAGAARPPRLRAARLAGSGQHARALAAADPLPLARRVAELADDEGAGDARPRRRARHLRPPRPPRHVPDRGHRRRAGRRHRLPDDRRPRAPARQRPRRAPGARGRPGRGGRASAGPPSRSAWPSPATASTCDASGPR